MSATDKRQGASGGLFFARSRTPLTTSAGSDLGGSLRRSPFDSAGQMKRATSLGAPRPSHEQNDQVSTRREIDEGFNRPKTHQAPQGIRPLPLASLPGKQKQTSGGAVPVARSTTSHASRRNINKGSSQQRARSVAGVRERRPATVHSSMHSFIPGAALGEVALKGGADPKRLHPLPQSHKNSEFRSASPTDGDLKGDIRGARTPFSILKAKDSVSLQDTLRRLPKERFTRDEREKKLPAPVEEKEKFAQTMPLVSALKPAFAERRYWSRFEKEQAEQEEEDRRREVDPKRLLGDHLFGYYQRRDRRTLETAPAAVVSTDFRPTSGLAEVVFEGTCTSSMMPDGRSIEDELESEDGSSDASEQHSPALPTFEKPTSFASTGDASKSATSDSQERRLSLRKLTSMRRTSSRSELVAQASESLVKEEDRSLSYRDLMHMKIRRRSFITKHHTATLERATVVLIDDPLLRNEHKGVASFDELPPHQKGSGTTADTPGVAIPSQSEAKRKKSVQIGGDATKERRKDEEKQPSEDTAKKRKLAGVSTATLRQATTSVIEELDIKSQQKRTDREILSDFYAANEREQEEQDRKLNAAKRMGLPVMTVPLSKVQKILRNNVTMNTFREERRKCEEKMIHVAAVKKAASSQTSQAVSELKYLERSTLEGELGQLFLQTDTEDPFLDRQADEEEHNRRLAEIKQRTVDAEATPPPVEPAEPVKGRKQRIQAKRKTEQQQEEELMKVKRALIAEQERVREEERQHKLYLSGVCTSEQASAKDHDTKPHAVKGGTNAFAAVARRLSTTSSRRVSMLTAASTATSVAPSSSPTGPQQQVRRQSMLPHWAAQARQQSALSEAQLRHQRHLAKISILLEHEMEVDPIPAALQQRHEDFVSLVKMEGKRKLSIDVDGRRWNKKKFLKVASGPNDSDNPSKTMELSLSVSPEEHPVVPPSATPPSGSSTSPLSPPSPGKPSAASQASSAPDPHQQALSSFVAREPHKAIVFIDPLEQQVTYQRWLRLRAEEWKVMDELCVGALHADTVIAWMLYWMQCKDILIPLSQMLSYSQREDIDRLKDFATRQLARQVHAWDYPRPWDFDNESSIETGEESEMLILYRNHRSSMFTAADYAAMRHPEIPPVVIAEYFYPPTVEISQLPQLPQQEEKDQTRRGSSIVDISSTPPSSMTKKTLGNDSNVPHLSKKEIAQRDYLAQLKEERPNTLVRPPCAVIRQLFEWLTPALNHRRVSARSRLTHTLQEQRRDRLHKVSYPALVPRQFSSPATSAFLNTANLLMPPTFTSNWGIGASPLLVSPLESVFVSQTEGLSLSQHQANEENIDLQLHALRLLRQRFGGLLGVPRLRALKGFKHAFQTVQEIEERFVEFDVDGDGYLNLEEFSSFAAPILEVLSRRKIKQKEDGTDEEEEEAMVDETSETHFVAAVLEEVTEAERITVREMAMRGEVMS